MPTRQTGEVIGPHQKHKIVGGVALAQGIERGDSVTGARQGELDVLRAQTRITSQGQLY